MRRRIEDVALEVVREQGRKIVWYGDPNLVLDIADRAGCKAGHPLNRSASVVGALAKSNKWKRRGVIQHLGRDYNVYEPILDEPTGDNAKIGVQEAV